MLDRHAQGWEIARQAAARTGGGATALLQLDPDEHRDAVARLAEAGWAVHPVRTMEELVAFARAFSRARYGAGAEGRA
jgi:hypothetical protein